MLRIGLIGAGYMGSMHAACYQALVGEGVTVAAVADIREEYAVKAAEAFQAKVYEDGMELIDHAEVDAIDICLPTYLHARFAAAAMKKGRAVFIEKPVCMKKEEMDFLLKTEEETKVPVMVGQCIRLWSEYAWLKDAVTSKVYGKVCSAVFKRVSPAPTWAWNGWLQKAECSGTVAMDMHIHDVDYVRYLLGEPKDIQATVSRDRKGMIQQIFAAYDYGNLPVTIEACWDYPESFPFEMYYRIKLEEATIVFSSSASPSLVVYPNAGGRIVPELEKEFESENDIGGNVSSLGGYYNELKYFTDRIQVSEPLTIATLSESVKSVELVLKEIEKAGGMIANG
ncbi:MAG: Gfo/Idh/MocA family oxidoreductase [Clostridiales bacterium]|nr:Gfo/Idh/MocA family oxidoreductase [Clostridiales bacterium]MDU3241045.1 Gfo/Idh/MocA family oxidoreductase [Clostridiales bacterium]